MTDQIKIRNKVNELIMEAKKTESGKWKKSRCAKSPQSSADRNQDRSLSIMNFDKKKEQKKQMTSEDDEAESGRCINTTNLGEESSILHSKPRIHLSPLRDC